MAAMTTLPPQPEVIPIASDHAGFALKAQVAAGVVDLPAPDRLERPLYSGTGTLPAEHEIEVLPELDEAFNVLHDKLGEYPREEIPVVLYSQMAFRDVTRAPDCSCALAMTPRSTSVSVSPWTIQARSASSRSSASRGPPLEWCGARSWATRVSRCSISAAWSGRH